MSNEVLELIDVITQKKELEQREKALKSKIMDGMKSGSLDQVIENEDVKITYMPPSTSKKFDSTAFKKENPKVYEMFTKESKKSEYLLVTVR